MSARRTQIGSNFQAAKDFAVLPDRFFVAHKNEDGARVIQVEAILAEEILNKPKTRKLSDINISVRNNDINSPVPAVARDAVPNGSYLLAERGNLTTTYVISIQQWSAFVRRAESHDPLVAKAEGYVLVVEGGEREDALAVDLMQHQVSYAGCDFIVRTDAACYLGKHCCQIWPTRRDIRRPARDSYFRRALDCQGETVLSFVRVHYFGPTLTFSQASTPRKPSTSKNNEARDEWALELPRTSISPRPSSVSATPSPRKDLIGTVPMKQQTLGELPVDSSPPPSSTDPIVRTPARHMTKPYTHPAS